MQPQLVDVDRPLILELEGPLAAMLVLRVLPLWPHAFLEEMVIRLESKFRNGGDVVLLFVRLERRLTQKSAARTCAAYIDSPEFLYRLESDDFLQQVIPVVALYGGIRLE